MVRSFCLSGRLQSAGSRARTVWPKSAASWSHRSRGVLCLFLPDMSIVAGRGLRAGRGLITMALLGFGVPMPLVGAGAGLVAALLLGLSTGGAVLLMVLGASASYIAVPAAMRVAVPEANPSVYLTLSLGVTFHSTWRWVCRSTSRSPGPLPEDKTMQTHDAKRGRDHHQGHREIPLDGCSGRSRCDRVHDPAGARRIGTIG